MPHTPQAGATEATKQMGPYRRSARRERGGGGGQDRPRRAPGRSLLALTALGLRALLLTTGLVALLLLATLLLAAALLRARLMLLALIALVLLVLLLVELDRLAALGVLVLILVVGHVDALLLPHGPGVPRRKAKVIPLIERDCALRRDAATVREDDRGITREPFAPRALERRAAKPLPELVVGHRHQRLRRRWRRGRRRLARDGRVAIPGADFLTDVAAEEPLADRRVELLRNRAPVLDRQVGDAAARVERVRRVERRRRTGVEAGRARPAAVRHRIVGHEHRGREHDPDEVVGAEAGRDEVGVLADPPEARSGGQIALEHGAGVERRAALRAGGRADVVAQRVQPRPHGVVVVGAARVASDATPFGLVGAGVVERDGDHRAAAGQEPRGIEPRLARLGEIIHRPGAAGVEPALEVGGVWRRAGGSDRDAIEAELERAGLHRLRERHRGEHHVFLAMTCRCARVSVRPPSSRNLI